MKLHLTMCHLATTDDLRSQGYPTNYEVCRMHNCLYGANFTWGPGKPMTPWIPTEPIRPCETTT